MASVHVNGMSFYYTEAGTGEPLLLIHGTGFNADVWDKVLAPLSEDFRVIAYDRRGYQRSRGPLPPAKEYGKQQGEDIAALLQALNAAPATLLGWSAGGIHALYATINHPNLVKRLILYEPPLHITRFFDPTVITVFGKLFFLKAIGKKSSASRTFVRYVLGYKDGRNSYDDLSDEFRAKLAQDSDILLAELGGGTGEDLTPEMLKTQIKVPVSLLLGAETPKGMDRPVESLASILQSPIIPVQNSNHLAHMDQPQAFIAAVRQGFASGVKT
jgi:pimeloyl-ACP methyl ester carboxylesterase